MCGIRHKMEIIDNVNRLLGDNLKKVIKPDSTLKIAAASFSIYAFEALKQEFERIDSLGFIFTLPVTARPGELLRESVDRVTLLRGKQSEIEKLTARLAEEKQFNRKVELNALLRTI